MFFAFLLILLAGCASPQQRVIPAIGTRLWMERIERVVDTRDVAGHGPEVGSAEWMDTVSRRLGVYDAQGHGPDPGSIEWMRAVHRKAFHIEPE